jgi:hypothetical protein
VFETPFLVKSSMHAPWLSPELGDSLIVPLAGGTPGLRAVLLDLLGRSMRQDLYLIALAGGLEGELDGTYRERLLARQGTLHPELADSLVYTETAAIIGTRGGFTAEAYRIRESDYHLAEPIILGGGHRGATRIVSVPIERTDWFPVVRFLELLQFNGRFSDVSRRDGIDYTAVLTAYCKTIASIGGCPILDLTDAESRKYLGVLGARIEGSGYEAAIEVLPNGPTSAERHWVLMNLMERFTTSPWVEPGTLPALA